MMLAKARQQKVIDLLIRQKSVKIRDLHHLFGVSEETVRRDLKKMEMDGLLTRTHGGAIVNEDIYTVPEFDQRKDQNREEKEQIAYTASNLVPEHATVMLDAGSTTLEIARKLFNRSVTVITNDLYIAMELCSSLTVQLIVLGGVQQKGHFLLTGPECEDAIHRYHVDMVFLSTGGISPRQGLTTASTAEAQVKRAMIEAAREVYCVADSSKFGLSALISYASTTDVQAIITNDCENNPVLLEIKNRGTQVVFSKPISGVSLDNH